MAEVAEALEGWRQMGLVKYLAKYSTHGTAIEIFRQAVLELRGPQCEFLGGRSCFLTAGIAI